MLLVAQKLKTSGKLEKNCAFKKRVYLFIFVKIFFKVKKRPLYLGVLHLVMVAAKSLDMWLKNVKLVPNTGPKLSPTPYQTLKSH